MLLETVRGEPTTRLTRTTSPTTLSTLTTKGEV